MVNQYEFMRAGTEVTHTRDVSVTMFYIYDYDSAEETETNLTLAAWRDSAARGSVDHQVALGRYHYGRYDNGDQGDDHATSAIKWLVKASQHGSD